LSWTEKRRSEAGVVKKGSEYRRKELEVREEGKGRGVGEGSEHYPKSRTNEKKKKNREGKGPRRRGVLVDQKVTWLGERGRSSVKKGEKSGKRVNF